MWATSEQEREAGVSASMQIGHEEKLSDEASGIGNHMIPRLLRI